MKVLLLDIETCPNTAYVWGVYQQYVSVKYLIATGYTLCWSAKWLGKREMMYASIEDDGEDEMLRKMYDLLEEADAIVHYNGTKFDIPTLNKEFLVRGWKPPAPYHQIDLFKVVKKNFRFPSYKLEFVALALGIGAKVKHMGLELWIGCMKGDPKCWRTMKRYNKQDVKLLEKLYRALLPWIKTHPNHALYYTDNRPRCTNCGSAHVQKRGARTTSTQIYDRFQCQKCGTWMRGRYTSIPPEKKPSILTQV